MYVATLFLAALSVAVVVTGESRTQDDEFNLYLKEYEKSYANSPLELSLRREIFMQNKRLIDSFNGNPDGSSTFRMGVNQFTDMTRAERMQHFGFRHSRRRSMRNSLEAVRFVEKLFENVTDADIPNQVDWTKVPGRVSHVKDQGNCGSCWSFAATGALEGQMALWSKSKSMVPLSEQNLIDCSGNDHGCHGGASFNALADVRFEGGIESESDYPYEAGADTCRFNKSKAIFNLDGIYKLNFGDEELLKKVVAIYGPVAIGINTWNDSFSKYESGIYYTNEDCSGKLFVLNHEILVVGYGHDSKTGLDYWLLKNSWGPKWGENGYMRIARNKQNWCGVASDAKIPTFKQ